MTTTELKRLNHYWEFRTNNDIDDIIHYIATEAEFIAKFLDDFLRKIGDRATGEFCYIQNSIISLYYIQQGFALKIFLL